MFQEYQTDTVQDLYNEIEHLIDVPFEKFSEDVQQYQISGAAAAEATEYAQYYQQEQQQHQQRDSSSDSASFDRPILIESDSDDIEEELLTPNQQYTYITCYRCNKILPFESNTLKVDNSNNNNNMNMCLDCTPKKRTRSRSFISEVADKLKNLGSSNSISLLSPSTAKLDRRNSMSSIIEAPTCSLAPSPTPSRPSSRASSFIEDVKQFLAPLSRKSSRNSMHQEYQQTEQLGPSRKTSHNSLLDAMNICKPKHQKSPSYERRLIDDPCTQQQGSEVKSMYQRHIPIRRKQIKKIEFRQDRMDIYNNAYLDCMQTPTDLIPWIVKQTQKGPPDDWFGYTPPARENKKVLGIFKKKAKSRGDARAQQLQLGDELLNRSTPLSIDRFSNSNLSVSPGGASSMCMMDMVQSPSDLSPQEQDDYNEEEGGEEYFGYHGQHINAASVSPNQSVFSPSSQDLSTPSTTRSQSTQPTQPVSILKKTNSNRQLQPDYAYQDAVPFENTQDEDYPHYYSQNAPYDDYDYEYESSRHYAHAPTHRQRSSSFVEAADINTYNNSRHGMMNEQEDYYSSMESSRRTNQSRSRSRSQSRSRSRSNSRTEDYYYHNTPRPTYYDEQPSSYYDQAPATAWRARDLYQAPPVATRLGKRSSLVNTSPPQDYYGSSAKLTPFMMEEEWEMALDDLSDIFPRLDRPYINDFLRSAQGDFMTAKNMIMDMIMEVR